MRLLVVVPWGYALGGAETMLLDFMAAAPERDVEIEALFLQDGPFVAEARVRGAVAHVVEAGRLRDVRSSVRVLRAIWRLVRTREPDVVLAWSPKMQLYAGVATLLARSPARVVWWQHGVPHRHWIDRLATVIPAAAVGASSIASAEAQARMRPRRHAFVAHPGIPDPHPVVGASLPFEDHALPVVGIVGRLQPWKGQDRLLRAVALMRDAGVDVNLLVVGGDAYALSPTYAAEVGRLVNELGLDRRVHLTGQVDDAVPLIAVMDVLVNASEQEPFGIVLLEAMACGKPVVAVASAGPLEIVEDGRTGILARSGSPQHLAEALARLVTDRELSASMGSAGRSRYLERFSAAAMAGRIAGELRSVRA